MRGGWGSSAYDRIPMGGVVYYAAHDASHGSELWRSDGTSEGSWLVRDRPGRGLFGPEALTVLGDSLYYVIRGHDHSELWRSGGTPRQTTRLLSVPNT